ncbi:hypothetical protein [Streptomyces sp. NPDC047042]|uniref:3'-5' exonuclease n=1 Tax=Streptomyces sp. NPDC047042 TaxID=3154807 RepID=UPI0033F7F3CD
MTLSIAFVDCETTHLSADIGEAWEVAVILREDNDPSTDTEYLWEFSIDPETVDTEALRIGRWHDRHQLPARTDQAAFTGSVPAVPMTRADAVKAIVDVLRGVVLVGSNPAFDDRFLRKLVGPGNAQWHYRPYDIVQLAAAKIGAQQAGPLPWSSYALSRAVGIEPPTAEAAHTALGDARWARDVHDAATRRQPYEVTVEGRAQHAMGLYTKTAVELEDVRHNLGVNEAAVQRVCALHRKATHGDNCVHCTAFGLAYDNTWPCETIRALAGSSQPVMTGQTQSCPGCGCTGHTGFCNACGCLDSREADEKTVAVSRTERSHWGDIAAALNAAHDAGMPVSIDLDGTLTDLNAWSVVWDPATERWTIAGYEDEGDVDLDEDDEEDSDSDGDVFELISEIAGRLTDATNEGEYHAVGLIADLANGRTTVADARTELAEITFRHI